MLWTVFLCATTALACPAVMGGQPRSVVVESVSPGGEAARAGIRACDVLLSWKRTGGTSPGSGRSAGPLVTWFDVEDLIQEQAPRGPIRIEAMREGERLVFELIRGPTTTGAGGDAPGHDLSHPFYWAAFQLYGDWR